MGAACSSTMCICSVIFARLSRSCNQCNCMPTAARPLYRAIFQMPSLHAAVVLAACVIAEHCHNDITFCAFHCNSYNLCLLVRLQYQLVLALVSNTSQSHCLHGSHQRHTYCSPCTVIINVTSWCSGSAMLQARSMLLSTRMTLHTVEPSWRLSQVTCSPSRPRSS